MSEAANKKRRSDREASSEADMALERWRAHLSGIGVRVGAKGRQTCHWVLEIGPFDSGRGCNMEPANLRFLETLESPRWGYQGYCQASGSITTPARFYLDDEPSKLMPPTHEDAETLTSAGVMYAIKNHRPRVFADEVQEIAHIMKRLQPANGAEEDPKKEMTRDDKRVISDQIKRVRECLVALEEDLDIHSFYSNY